MRLVPALLRCILVGMVVGLGPVAPVAAGAECPTRVTFEPTGAATVDLGWSGLGHDSSLPGDTLDLAVSCANSTPPCGACSITGVVGGSTHPLRCKANPAIACTPATEVAACGAPASCRMLLSPPQSVPVGFFQLCLLPSVAPTDVTGTVDVETGALAATIDPEVRVYSGIHGCPSCLNDVVVGDGVPDGTCDEGARAGQACDANAVSTYADYGATSFGCPPAPQSEAGRFTFDGLPISTGTQTLTLTADSPNCLGKPGKKCFCGICNNPNRDLCSSHADCPTSGGHPGVCNGKRCIGGADDGTPCSTSSECSGGGLCGVPGEPARPSACLDDTVDPLHSCRDVGSGHGECVAGPVDKFCSSHPNRTCNTDADCDGIAGSCHVANRRCALDNGIIGESATVSGVATAPVSGVAEPTTLGALGCMSSTVNVWVDSGGGFPGPVRGTQTGRLVFGGAAIATTTPTPTPTPLPGVCPSSPAVCRAPFTPHKAKVLVTNRTPDEKDRLQWKWLGGTATTLGDFGDPIGGDDYALCLYDASGLRSTIDVPGGGVCGGKPCWQRKSNGFRYRDKAGSAGGIVDIVLKPGGDGKAQVQLKGTGPGLPLFPLTNFDGAFRVQLRHRASGVCFGAAYSQPFDYANGETVKDRAD